MADLLLSKFAMALVCLDAVESEEKLIEELRKDELLKRAVVKLVELVSPYVPLLGLLRRYYHRYRVTFLAINL